MTIEAEETTFRELKRFNVKTLLTSSSFKLFITPLLITRWQSLFTEYDANFNPTETILVPQSSPGEASYEPTTSLSQLIFDVTILKPTFFYKEWVAPTENISSYEMTSQDTEKNIQLEPSFNKTKLTCKVGFNAQKSYTFNFNYNIN